MRSVAIMLCGLGAGQALSAWAIDGNLRAGIAGLCLVIGGPLYLYARHKDDERMFADLRSVVRGER